MTTAIELHRESLPQPVAAIAEILNRPMPFASEQDRCVCSECTRLRTIAFSCDVCGYAGEPLVEECTCDDRHITGVRTLGRCDASSPDCGHGHVDCPVCVTGADLNGEKNGLGHAWSIVHDVRALLVNLGPALALSSSIDAKIVRDTVHDEDPAVKCFTELIITRQRRGAECGPR